MNKVDPVIVPNRTKKASYHFLLMENNKINNKSVVT